jgi:putative holliday junction resolvase
MPRFLGIDYGSRRIGLAVGDSVLWLASPVTMVAGGDDVDRCIERVLPFVAEYAADELVVGLPINMDDSEGPQARLTRKFGDALSKKTRKPVHYFDERLSSRAADDLLGPAELTRKKHKARQDAVAAQIMLQGFLDERRSAAGA